MMATQNRSYLIHYKGLAVGKHTFRFEIGDTFFTSVEGCEISAGKCTADIVLEKGNNLLILNTVIKGEATVACDRCLEEVTLPVDYSGKLYVKFSPEVEESYLDVSAEGDDVLWMNPQEDGVDLTQYLYDCINLALPLQRVHGTDAEGNPLCDPDMLARFTTAPEEEPEE